jgi:hypothetical protein
VHAGDLEPGERLLSQTGETLVLASVEPLPGAQQVYNLEVETEHVYFVGDAGVLVHNYPTSAYIDNMIMGPKGRGKAEKFKTRTREETATLRREFDQEIRPEYLKHMAEHERGFLEAKGLSDNDIADMASGKVPNGWETHHIKPLYRGGDNSHDNLDLLPSSYHRANFDELHYYPNGQNPYGVD